MRQQLFAIVSMPRSTGIYASISSMLRTGLDFTWLDLLPEIHVPYMVKQSPQSQGRDQSQGTWGSGKQIVIEFTMVSSFISPYEDLVSILLSV